MLMPELNLNIADAYSALRPLALFAVGVAIYGFLVFHFYRFLARKEILKLDLSKHNQARRPLLRKIIAVIFNIVVSLILFPTLIFFWFVVMAGLLYLMNSDRSIESIMLAAMGVVAAIRVCSYYSASLATDVAKILPLALLGIMLIDSSLLGLSESAEGIREAAIRWETVIYYLVGVVVLEFVLRLAWGAWGLLRNAENGTKAPIESSDSPIGRAESSADEGSAHSDGPLRSLSDTPGDAGVAADGNTSPGAHMEGPDFGHMPSRRGRL